MPQATHFAYYAELRAAISLFSAHGIQIRNANNVYIAQSGATIRPWWKGDRTHSIVWSLWKEWAGSPTAEALFMNQLKILPDVTMGDLRAAAVAIPAGPALKQWGFDLSLDQDHTARNAASYRTNHAREALSPMNVSEYEFVKQIWVLLAPSGHGLTFEQELARYFLDLAMDQISIGDRAAWRSRVAADVVRATGTNQPKLELVLNAPLRAQAVLEHAFENKTTSKNLIARALFLLRIATLFPSGAFRLYPTSAATSWLKDWLVNVGVLDAAASDPPDVWDDFADLSEIDAPSLPLPAGIFADQRVAYDSLRLARADALLAWGTEL